MALTIEGPTPAQPAAPPTEIVLRGEIADAYVARLDRAIRAARLNALFPPSRPLRAHLGFLGPAGSRGLYDELQLSPLTGLPNAREILRVKIDKDLTAEFLARAADQRAPQPGSPLARRIDYYAALAETEVMPASRLAVDLRQQIESDSRALFRVLFDRFDIATGMFVRYTIMLSQRDSFWGQRHLIVDDADLAAPTERFRRIIGRFTAHEAELAFILLSKLDEITVEDVRRCRIGPLLMPGVDGIGSRLEALLDPARTPEAAEEPPWILCFPEDRAGVEVTEHSSGDPLAQLYRDAVSESARELVDAKADELGYRVAKSRKFVCPRPLRGPLSELCRELGRPSIVRGV
jgi:hypothetical protein